MSGSVKFYALVTRNLTAVKRHIETIPKADLVIVINTQDSDFETAVDAWCGTESIEHHITVSDGTAATGKNSVIDLFNASDNDYMVLVDGDDYITGHGVWTYKQLAAMDSPPDVVALEYQIGLTNSAEHMSHCPEPPPITANMDPNLIPSEAVRPFYFPHEWWASAKAGESVDVTPNDPNDFAARLSVVHERWSNHCWSYINNWETHCRIVFFSKAAFATGHRFDPTYVVGEDTILYFELKHEAHNNNIVMKHLFDRYPTYVYDCRIGGVVSIEKDRNGHDIGWYDWLLVLTDAYDDLEAAGKMHETQCPRINVFTVAPSADYVFTASDWDIVWPEGYIPDVDSLVNYPGKRIIKL